MALLTDSLGDGLLVLLKDLTHGPLDFILLAVEYLVNVVEMVGFSASVSYLCQ